MRRLATILVAGLWASGTLLPQITPYELKVETQPGVVVVTFSTGDDQARVYLPDDLAPGDPFSGTVDASRKFLLEFGGQRTETAAATFRGTVPQPESGDFVPLILRTLKGQELARASIHIAGKTSGDPVGTPGFRVPRLIRAGTSFPILGPFDGNSESTSIMLGGKVAPLLAKSPRKTVVRAPDSVIGVAQYQLNKNGVVQTGETRSLGIEMKASAAPRRDNDPPVYELSLKGLAGIQDNVPLRVGQNYFYLRPDAVLPSGTFTVRRSFNGVKPEAPAAELIIPQTPAEEVSVVLRTPRRETNRDPGDEHARALRLLDFDPIPVLAGYLADFELGSDAAYAMLSFDEARALKLLFGSMPASGQNVARLSLTWFLDHYDFVHGSPSAAEAHAAALRLLNRSANSGTVVTDLALYVVGLTGSQQDFPLLEKFYENKDRWGDVKGTHDASEAALARLGSRKHLEVIRAELAPLPANATLPDGLRLVQSIEKAGFTGSMDLAPEICTHVGDRIVLEIDIWTNPSQHALTALSAIVDKTNPRGTAAKRTLDEWHSYCQAVGLR
jgi:hypothetical protein